MKRAGFLGHGGRAALLALLLGGFHSLRRGKQPPRGARDGWGVLRPPGARAESSFLTRCIRCTRCADACLPQCILFFGPEAGESQGTPYLLPAERGCTLCLECGRTCPTGALAPLTKMSEAAMGIAEVDKRLCVALIPSGVCGACHTICPLRNRAIHVDMRNAPRIDPEQCVGCGLCEEICIVKAPHAIRVRSRRPWPNPTLTEVS